MYMQCPQRPKEDIGSPGMELKLYTVFWVLELESWSSVSGGAASGLNCPAPKPYFRISETGLIFTILSHIYCSNRFLQQVTRSDQCEEGMVAGRGLRPGEPVRGHCGNVGRKSHVLACGRKGWQTSASLRDTVDVEMCCSDPSSSGKAFGLGVEYRRQSFPLTPVVLVRVCLSHRELPPPTAMLRHSSRWHEDPAISVPWHP